MRFVAILFLLVFTNRMETVLSAQDDNASKGAGSANGIYDSHRLLNVSIKLNAGDWLKLRKQHRDFMRERPPGSDPYDYFKADVEIDGVRIGSVGVSKKGNLGSSVTTRPSLKIKFDEYESDRSYQGVKRMTLNNNNQDSSRINQFIAYKFFRSGNIPAPRCNLAAVTVNGEYLGIYSNIEPIKKPLLKRYFDNANGNIYEGRRMERKNNRNNPERDDVARLNRALGANDTDLLEELSGIVNLDSFLSLWVMESFVGHWDSYSGNNNNFYAYHDPDSGKFTVIPWGADAVFMDPGPFMDASTPRSVKANGRIAERLYGIPDGRRMYLERLRHIIQNVWSAETYLEEIDRLEEMISERIVVDEVGFLNELADARKFIQSRRSVIENELAKGAPVWDPPVQPVSPSGRMGALSGRFQTEWGTMPIADRYSHGAAEIKKLELHGNTISFSEIGVAVGFDKKWIRPDYPMIEIYGLNEERDKQWIVFLAVDPLSVKLNTPIPVDFFTVFGTLRSSSPEGREYEDLKKIGWLVGELVLEKFGDSPGDIVAGSFDLTIR